MPKNTASAPTSINNSAPENTPKSSATRGLSTRTVTVPQRVAADIRAKIDADEWPPGTRIPTEMTLAKTYGIGRGSVREALRSLVHSGLLEARAGDGTYVRARSELQVQLTRRVSPDHLDDLLEVRALLERHTARRAAERATPAEHAALREALALRDASDNVKDYIGHDVKFHEIIVRAAGNSLLADLYVDLDAVATQLESLPIHGDDVEAFRAFITHGHESHHELLDAIVSGDADRADALAAHLVECARSMFTPAES
ncbi:DNA-binding FadR family transcriptional regulator [Mycetocola sp. BIGb0189]|uniref:FadR/GntR family transcriptional regulator n=1 Tax=Mycetocola sp. BIGb0189 TaxID=2940604 RepID=UPI00216A9425|nr:FadR/GntR family transcriptional regulator [Mycetocola sp. BIGb0189]MCS4277416.1 DNA-binding FadR family transcriptional regulator [Mycetocola sp. BIGb0189]